MRCLQRSDRLLICLYAFAVWAMPHVGLAGDEVLFRYAAASRIDEELLSPPQSRATPEGRQRVWCFDALVGLRRERETMRLSEAWLPVGDIDEYSLRACWKHELYWAGLNLARRSKLPLAIKLSSLAGHDRVPPESLIRSEERRVGEGRRSRWRPSP